MADEGEIRGMSFHLDWNIPEDIVARYATNLVVQRGENEFILSFFEAKPPFLLGTPEEVNEKINSIKSVRANCVAQIIVAADKMPSFVEALQKNLEKFMTLPVENKDE